MAGLRVFIYCLFLFLLGLAQCEDVNKHGIPMINIQNSVGQTLRVPVNRRPTLYTDTFADCNGSGDFSVSQFNAAYYKDNMTVIFNLEGTSRLNNESLVMMIDVYAYGENRFTLLFNPCKANIFSACPILSNRTFEAVGSLPVAPRDIANIPPISETIPDFEGQAVFRLFSNRTQSEVGCFVASVTNGVTLSHPTAVGTILGFFTVVTLILSFLVSVCSDDKSTSRLHHSHTVSVVAIFAVFQHIFFTGTLSVAWPGVLPAFWSNYAWAAGLISNHRIQSAVDKFIPDKGNLFRLGSMSTGPVSMQLAGGYKLRNIYRSINQVMPRAVDPLMEYTWLGDDVQRGLPIPGNFSSFPGTLSMVNIASADAFLTSLIWFLFAIVLMAGSLVLLKFVVQGLCNAKILRNDRLLCFRQSWIRYTFVAIFRTLLGGFFMMTLLSLFQIAHFPGAAVPIAAVVLALGFFGAATASSLTILYRYRNGNLVFTVKRARFVVRKIYRFVPVIAPTLAPLEPPQMITADSSSRSDGSSIRSDATLVEKDSTRNLFGTFSFPVPVLCNPGEPGTFVLPHDDTAFLQTYGWLYSRFRQSRWWFFVYWFIYEFVRACFIGAAAANPFVQVFGLLTLEIIVFITVFRMKPYESRRLNGLVVYALGLSKVLTTGLSASFIPYFKLPRILATGIGIIIVVIQGILTLLVLGCIISGVFTAYLSMKHAKTDDEFHPRAWNKTRRRYFRHIERIGAEGKEWVDEDEVEKPAKRSWKQLFQRPNQEEKGLGSDEPTFRVERLRRLTLLGEEVVEYSILDHPTTGSTPTIRPVASAATLVQGIEPNPAFPTSSTVCLLPTQDGDIAATTKVANTDPLVIESELGRRSSVIYRPRGYSATSTHSVLYVPNSTSSRTNLPVESVPIPSVDAIDQAGGARESIVIAEPKKHRWSIGSGFIGGGGSSRPSSSSGLFATSMLKTANEKDQAGGECDILQTEASLVRSSSKQAGGGKRTSILHRSQSRLSFLWDQKLVTKTQQETRTLDDAAPVPASVATTPSKDEPTKDTDTSHLKEASSLTGEGKHQPLVSQLVQDLSREEVTTIEPPVAKSSSSSVGSFSSSKPPPS